MPEPRSDVIAAFGLAGSPEPLARGSTAVTWRVGHAVLKPLEGPALVAETFAAIIESILDSDRFALARPVRATDGRVVVGGWTASTWQPGRPQAEWRDIIRAGEAFHEALRAVPRPGILDTQPRTDPWAIADRVAWGEAALPGTNRRPAVLVELIGCLSHGPVASPAQLIHGDLSGNVLFAPGRPPAIIDFSPYWRPPAYATAIVVADARWSGEAGADLERWAAERTEGFQDTRLRALAFRAVTQWLIRPESFDRATARAIRELAGI